MAIKFNKSFNYVFLIYSKLQTTFLKSICNIVEALGNFVILCYKQSISKDRNIYNEYSLKFFFHTIVIYIYNYITWIKSF